MTNPKPNTHGGRRPNAGRKPQGTEPRLRVCVTMTRSEQAKAHQIGNNNVSAGISRALADWEDTAITPQTP